MEQFILPSGIITAETYTGMGLLAMLPALSFALCTGPGEEIFWSGFLGKRLAVMFGFTCTWK
jgi:hypothetical protein